MPKILPRHELPKSPVLFFDGECRLCDATVNWVLDHDKKKLVFFAPLQSSLGQEVLRENAMDTAHLSTLVLLDEGHVYTKSDAALRLFGHMGGFWSLLKVFRIVPRWLRNRVYDVISANRYKWFGRYDVCRMPDANHGDRFLEIVEPKELEATNH